MDLLLNGGPDVIKLRNIWQQQVIAVLCSLYAFRADPN